MNPEQTKAILDQVAANYNTLSLALISARASLQKVQELALPKGTDPGDEAMLAYAQSGLRQIEDYMTLIGDIR